MGESEERYRLPRTVVPSRYDLTLEPDLDAGTFDGTIEVALQVLEPVTEIVLNANELRLDGATLTAADGRAVEVSKILTDDEAERATLPLAETAEPGDWTLRITYAGELNPRLTGFYRSTYQDEDGATRVVGTTHFEATDARRAFPCWDEPDLKAVFAITLVVKEGLTAVSNGPEVERETLDDGRVRIRFGDTMKMSTYLAAWVVGPLEITEPADARGVPVRIVHVPGKGALTSFALDVERPLPELVRGLLRHPVPGGQARQRRDPGLRAGSDGERRLRDVSRAGAAARPGPVHAGGAARRRGDRRARAGPHVVRGPRDDALVERDLAERGVRDVHVDARGRRLPAGLGDLEHVHARPDERVRGRRAGDDPADRVRGPLAGRRQRDVRHPHVREGRRGAADARAVARRRSDSATGSAGTSGSTPTGTPRRTISGTRSRRRRASPSVA